nr:hypothetical protein CFP56_73569 [Quercus suber]
MQGLIEFELSNKVAPLLTNSTAATSLESVRRAHLGCDGLDVDVHGIIAVSLGGNGRLEVSSEERWAAMKRKNLGQGKEEL